MNQHVVVAEQFRGPPDSGNGGYVSGLLAGYLSPSAAAEGVEVTLRAPTWPVLAQWATWWILARLYNGRAT